MDKTLVFKWISLAENGENSICLYQEDLSLNYTRTKLSLLPTVKLVKQIDTFEGISLTLGSDDNRIFIDGLTTPIRLVERKKTGHYYRETTLISNGPSLKWLLKSMTEINNPDPNKLLYMKDMVVRFEPFKEEGTAITFLKIDNIKHILKVIRDAAIEWLGYETFNTLLAPYGYTNEAIDNGIAFTLMVYRCAKQLEFKNPKEVTGHFCDKRLIAELTLKGVFNKLLED